MNAITSILVIVDPTTQQHAAVEKAAALASKARARIELYVCETRAVREARLSRGSGHGSLDLKLFLEKLARPLREEGIDVVTEIDLGDPLWEKLVEKIRRATVSLVVKDTHHHSLAQRTFLNNTDWQLIRACPVPLLLTKPAAWRQPPRIFAAVDPGHTNDKPSTLDDQILDQANCFAKHLGGELHALHAYVPVSIIAAAVSSEPPTALAVSEEDLKAEQSAKVRQVTEVTRRFEISPDRIHVQLGGPAQLLPQATRQLGADILTMGALSRRGLKRIFIGSTAEDVLEHLPCDVLIVKPTDFAEALQGLCP
ncbi:universal stress protein E [Povalibacter uvarum]|uniref:Universal stress protein E n=1 Tax=Povalibacter uvarum TaxID=732238 RepID=A0A841HH78_9GAMM|nr:universal stress protein [Povalibacter uvarum]MBB6092126.1 universal stress protein E [Povalibacter uvarum]